MHNKALLNYMEFIYKLSLKINLKEKYYFI